MADTLVVTAFTAKAFTISACTIGTAVFTSITVFAHPIFIAVKGTFRRTHTLVVISMYIAAVHTGIITASVANTC